MNEHVPDFIGTHLQGHSDYGEEWEYSGVREVLLV
jgi:hypothetical protein